MAAPKRISLALVLHNHQPVGNFGWVIEEVFKPVSYTHLTLPTTERV